MQDADLPTMQKACKMGRVCRICDRKFFLRASFEKHAKEIKHYTDLEASKASDLTRKQRKLGDLQNSALVYKQNTMSEEQRHDDLAATAKQQLEELRQFEEELK